jgi:hypothetical protein
MRTKHDTKTNTLRLTLNYIPRPDPCSVKPVESRRESERRFRYFIIKGASERESESIKAASSMLIEV